MIIGTIVSLITGGYMVMIISRHVRHYDCRNNRQYMDMIVSRCLLCLTQWLQEQSLVNVLVRTRF